MQRIPRPLSAQASIILGALFIGACLLAQPFLRPYDVRISDGAVIRTNRLTGEVVLCNLHGCFKMLAGGLFNDAGKTTPR